MENMAQPSLDTSQTTFQTQHDEHLAPIWLNLFFAFVFSVIMVTTIVGNALVIVAVMTTKKLQTITNHFVSSLAVADFFIGVIVMPPATLLELNGGVWSLGKPLCETWVSVDVLLCSASIYSLCVISTDRYWSVTQPLAYSRARRSKSRAKRMIALGWSLAVAIALPLRLCATRDSSEAGNKCSLDADTWYVVLSACCGFFLPMLLILYLYSRIYCAINNRLRNLDDCDGAGQGIPLDTFRRDALSSTNDDAVADQASIPFSRCTRLLIATISVGLPIGLPVRGNTRGTLIALIKRASRRQRRRLASRAAALDRLRRQLVGKRERRRARRETKTVGTLAMVVGAFIVCWLPFFVTYLATPFVPAGVIPELLVSALNWLGWTNSAINPLIYAFYSADFRKAFLRLMMLRKR